MQLEDMSITELRPYPRNARTHTSAQIDQLAASIREFGFTNPVLVDADGMIVAGHGRVEAAKRLGWPTVPCLRLEHLSPKQVRAYIIADNALAELAGWDKELLTLEIQELQAINYPLELLGLDQLDSILAQLLGTEGLTNPDDVPEVPAEPITKTGDLWHLGAHRLLCGDSTQALAWQALMESRLADLIVTDPPYGVSYADKNKFLNAIDRGNRIQEEIHNDHGKIEDIAKVWKAVFDCLYQVSRQGAVAYVTAPQGGDQGLMMMMMMMMMMQAAFPVKHELIWLKNNHVLGRADYAYKHEPIFYSWKGSGHKYYGGFHTSVFEFPKPLKNDLHPTMKPVALFEKLICNSSLPGELVIDAFLGSGTTLIAAEKTGRVCYGMELSPHYCDVIVKRWEDFTGQKAVLVPITNHQPPISDVSP